MSLAGIYRAVVTNVSDPMEQARIKVRAPDALGELESNWAEPSFQQGAAFIPMPGHTVWVMFEGGNPAKPVWLAAGGGTTGRGVTIGTNEISAFRVTADQIDSGTVQSTIFVGNPDNPDSKFATALTGARAEMDAHGFHAYDAQGNVVELGRSGLNVLQIKDSGGVLRGAIGLRTDGTYGIQSFNTPGANAPSTPIVTGVIGGLAISWDGYLNGGASPDLSVRKIDVHVDVTAGFTPSSANLVGSITPPVPTAVGGSSARGGSLVYSSRSYTTVYYVCLIAVNDAGVESAASAQATGTPLQTAKEDIVQGTITADRLNLGVTANIIKDPPNTDAVIKAARNNAMPAGISINSTAETATGVIGAYAFTMTPAGAGLTRTYIWDAPVPVDAGKAIRVAMWINRTTSGTDGTLNVLLHYTKADGTTVDTAVTDYPISLYSGDVATGWTYYEGTDTAPANAIGVQLLAYSFSTTTGAWQLALPEMFVLSGVIQSADYVQGAGGFKFSSTDSQVGTYLNVIGTLGAQNITAKDSISIGGMDVVDDILAGFPKGLLAYGDSRTWTADSATLSGTTDVIVSEFNCGVVPAGRNYMLIVTFSYSVDTASWWQFRVRYTTDNTTPTSSSIILCTWNQQTAIATCQQSVSMIACSDQWSSSAPNPLRLALFARAVPGGGGGNAVIDFTHATNPHTFSFIDLGDSANNVAGTLSQKSGATGAKPPTTYTTKWNPLWSDSYDGNSSERSPSTSDLYQGYYSSTHGNTKSMVGFGNLSGTLSGATISKVVLTFRVKHAYSSSGLRTVIGTHSASNTSSGPSTFSQLDADIYDAGSPKHQEGSTYTVTLPNTASLYSKLIAGTVRGFTFGPGLSNSSDYFGYLYGQGSGSGPTLTITYTK